MSKIMRQFKGIIIILILFVSCSNLKQRLPASKNVSLSDSCLTLTDTIQLSELRERVYKKAKEGLSKKLRLKNINLSNITVKKNGKIGKTWNNFQTWTFFIKKKKLGAAQINIINDTLKFDIVLNIKRANLYSYMLLEVLKEHPQIKKVPVDMGSYYKSDNMKSFIDYIIKNGNIEYDFLANDEFHNKKTRTTARQLIIEAFVNTPLFRARRNVGFSKIKKIFVNGSSKVLAVIEKGATSSLDEIDVIFVGLKKNEAWSIKANGELKKQDYKSAVSLGLYDKMNP